MHPTAIRQRLEMLIGILGTFSIIAFINAVATQSIGSSMVLLMFSALTGLAALAWRKNERTIISQHESSR